MRKFRKTEGLRAAARAMGFKNAYLSDVEKGKKPASAGLIKAAAAHYGVSELEVAKSCGSPPEAVRAALKDPRWWDVICSTKGDPRKLLKNCQPEG